MVHRRGRAWATLTPLVALLVATALVPVTGASAATSTTTGVTRTTVTVGGLVGADPASTGAEIGAQARFKVANDTGELGKGVTIE